MSIYGPLVACVSSCIFSSHRSGGHMKATQRPLNGHSMATQWPLHFYGVFCDPNITKQSDLYKV